MEVEAAKAVVNAQLKGKLWAGWTAILAGLAVLGIGILYSVSQGALDIPLHVTWEAILHPDKMNPQHLIINNLRLPRALASAMIGAAFAVAGAVMQGITRNPMADSGLMGLNAGSGFVLAICFAFFSGISYLQIILLSFIGAALGALLVYGIASMQRGGATPMRLVLAGAAVTALLTALSQGIAIYFNVSRNLMFWTSGGVAGSDWQQLRMVAPVVGATLLGAMILSRSISLMNLGEDVAQGLGLRTGMVKAAGTIIVLLLAGTSVAVVGAVGFIGLVIPHITRGIVGPDYRFIIPASAVLGALLLVLADLAARMLNPPSEIPVGALVALIGIPFFLYLARKQRRAL
ncbi:MAG: feuB 4 [Paenibacillaceae bacterium]|jgi:iron complex transport system permease protein|nr:feuB 4 [Paenibacillaceae bacterium]